MSFPLDAVFFDFDGLILDTELPAVVAWQQVFRSRGVEFPDWLWIEMIGRSIETVSIHPADLANQLGVSDTRDTLLADHRERRAKLIRLERVLPGVHERIQEVKELGLHSAIVSSSSRKWIEDHLSMIGFSDAFQHVFCGYEDLPAKPDPALYLAAVSHFNVEPDRVLTLEDSPNGIAAAKAAGILCVAVPNELTSRLDLSAADFQVDSLASATIQELAEHVTARNLLG